MGLIGCRVGCPETTSPTGTTRERGLFGAMGIEALSET